MPEADDSLDEQGRLARTLRRLVRASQLWLPGAGLAWMSLWLLAVVSARGRPPLLTSIFVGGALGLWTLVIFAAFTSLSACLPARWFDHTPTVHVRARVALLVVSIGTVGFLIGRMVFLPVFARILPAIDLRSIFINAAAWGAAGLTGGLGVVIAGRRNPRFALAMLAVILLVARWSARDVLPTAFAGREVLLEVATIVTLFLTLSPLAAALVGRWRFLRHVAVGIFAAILLCVGASSVWVGTRVEARAWLVREYPGPAGLLARARLLFDLDGDGYASVLGGTDCDDSDPDVNPAALEIVGNGRDDNCLGGDLPTWTAPVDGPSADHPIHRSMVFITIDALRADMLGPGHMDRLVAFARGGARFTRAYSVAGLTDYGLRSLMTGRYPMDFTDGAKFLGQELSMAERFHHAGYRTVAVHSVWAINPYTLQGFAEVDDSLSELNKRFAGVTAEQTSDRAIAHVDALARTGLPFFLWVHYYDPHSDYIPRPGAPDFGGGPAGAYQQEVWATDRAIGRFLDFLDQSGFLADNVVAVTADHGEMLGEHGHLGHAFWQYEPVLRVPLVVHGPGVTTGSFPVRVRSLDLYPTLLHLTLGADPSSDGRNLMPVWNGSETKDRDVFVFSQYLGSDTRTTLMGPWKLMQDLRTGLEQLVNLDADPHENQNLIEQHSDIAAQLRHALGSRWDESLNDQMMRRKLRNYGQRRMVGEVRDRNERRKLEFYCSEGYVEDCEALKHFKPSAP